MMIISLSFYYSLLKLSIKNDSEKYRLLYSYSKIEWPSKIYKTNGEYLWFKNVYVEIRDRVKLISGKYGIF